MNDRRAIAGCYVDAATFRSIVAREPDWIVAIDDGDPEVFYYWFSPDKAEGSGSARHASACFYGDGSCVVLFTDRADVTDVREVALTDSSTIAEHMKRAFAFVDGP